MTAEETVAAICQALAGISIVTQDEPELSRLVEDQLTSAGLLVLREVALTKRDRIDFMVNDVGIELKIATSPAAMLRQLDRYAEHEMVSWLVLITTSRKLSAAIPRTLNGKRITKICMGAL